MCHMSRVTLSVEGLLSTGPTPSSFCHKQTPDTKPHNNYIKYQSNCENYDQHSFFWTKFRCGQIFLYLQWDIFSTRESSLGLTGWNFSYQTICQPLLRTAHCTLKTVHYISIAQARSDPRIIMSSRLRRQRV